MTLRRTLKQRGSIFYILPAVLVFLFVIAFPLLESIIYSFTNYRMESFTYRFVGFNNYIRMFKDEVFLGAIKNTLVLTVAVAFLQNAFSLYVAVTLNNKLFKGRNICRTIIFIPVLISCMVLGYMWKLLLSPYRGPLKMILSALEITDVSEYNLLVDPKSAFTVIILTMVWQYIGYNMVIYLSGLQNIPSDITEAAQLDGADGWKNFIHITFPMILPSVTTNLLLNIVGCLKCFEYVYVMTNGGPNHATDTVATLMYSTSFGQGQIGYGCAISVILAIATAIVGIIQVRFTRSKEVDL